MKQPSCELSNMLCIACGKQFIQNTALQAISTISQWGSWSKGRVFFIAFILSFTVGIYCSISGTCSSQEVVFILMPATSVCFLIHSNCLSMRMYHILKPLPWYVLITYWSDLMSVDFLSSFIISIIPKQQQLGISCQFQCKK